MDNSWRRARLRDAKLYLLATAAVSALPLDQAVDRAIDGGVDVVQLREKTASDDAFVASAHRLAALCRARSVIFVVNDRVEIARACGADGVHLGQEDRSVADARAVLGVDALVGISTHDGIELTAALAPLPLRADYVGVGSAFPTATKGRAVPVPGPETVARLAAAAESAGVPAFAIGGIDGTNVGELAQRGVRRVAVCAGILASADPRAAAAAIRSRL